MTQQGPRAEQITPWTDWPEIVSAARECGWRVLAERAGTARLERRDPRSASGAVQLFIQFDEHGAIADAWTSGLDRRLDADPTDMLAAVTAWLREDITAELEAAAALKAANRAWAEGRMAVMRERVAEVGRRGTAALAEQRAAEGRR